MFFVPAQGPIAEGEAAEEAAPQEDGEKHLSLPKNLPLPHEAVAEAARQEDGEKNQEGFWQVKRLEGREREAIAERVRAYTPNPEHRTLNPRP